MRTQPIDIARIQKFYRMAKCRVFDSLLVRQIQPIGERWLFNVPLQPRPARKSIFAGDGELRVAEAELSVEDFGICGPTETRMKFPDPLGRSGVRAACSLNKSFA